MNKKALWIGIPVVIVLVAGGLWVYWNYLAPPPEPQNTPLSTPAEANTPTVVSAEGKVLPASQVLLGFAQGGRISEVLVSEGELVEAGQALVELDRQAQEAALRQAQAGYSLAETNLKLARSHYEEVLAAAILQEAPQRTLDWQTPQADEIEQPAWYFDRQLEIEAAQESLEEARKLLEIEHANLEDVLQRAVSADLIAAEKRLAKARSDFLIADEVLSNAKKSRDNDLIEQAQETWDQANSALEAAQKYYEQILSTQAAQDVLEARARLAIAQERYDQALERYYRLLSGEESLAVKSARQAVEQAEAALAEAEAAVQSARVALDQTTLSAPVAGTVITVWLDAGEMAAPAQPVILIADLKHWVVETTDLSEVDVVLVENGMEANISLDAFPDEHFSGIIEKISLKGEEQRGEMTYTIRITFDPHGAAVRWGMTAFVEITLP